MRTHTLPSTPRHVMDEVLTTGYFPLFDGESTEECVHNALCNVCGAADTSGEERRGRWLQSMLVELPSPFRACSGTVPPLYTQHVCGRYQRRSDILGVVRDIIVERHIHKVYLYALSRQIIAEYTSAHQSSRWIGIG